MRALIYGTCGVALTMLAACGSSQKGDSTGVVNVIGAISSPTPLKVSDLGSKITYVPLETNDSSLVPRRWALCPTDNRLLVVVYSPWGMGRQTCLSFDFDGKFLGTIGYTGEDPVAYSNPFPLVSSDGNKLYFIRWGANGAYEQVYSANGEYLGKATPAIPPLGNPASSVLLDSMITSVSGRTIDGNLYFSVYTGGLNGGADTVYQRPFEEQPTERKAYQQSVSSEVHGVMLHSTALYEEIEELGGDRRHEYGGSRFNQTLWTSGNTVRYRYSLSDTIFSISGNNVSCAYVFDCGENGLKLSQLSKELPADVVLVSEAIETSSQIVFGASRGWMNVKGHEPFVGYFDKATGKTFAAPASEGFVDDLTGFMPFYPVMSNNRGDLFGILTMDDIAEWREAHPDAQLPEALRNLDDEANPIIVIVSQ